MATDGKFSFDFDLTRVNFVPAPSREKRAGSKAREMATTYAATNRIHVSGDTKQWLLFQIALIFYNRDSSRLSPYMANLFLFFAHLPCYTRKEHDKTRQHGSFALGIVSCGRLAEAKMHTSPDTIPDILFKDGLLESIAAVHHVLLGIMHLDVDPILRTNAETVFRAIFTLDLKNNIDACIAASRLVGLNLQALPSNFINITAQHLAKYHTQRGATSEDDTYALRRYDEESRNVAQLVFVVDERK